MRFKSLWVCAAVLMAGVAGVSAEGFSVFDPCPDLDYTADGKWKLHDPARPWPERAEPKGKEELLDLATPPKESIILFDGSRLDEWQVSSVWSIQNGVLVVQPASQDLLTKKAFGSCRLHLEWMAPADSKNSGQNRANSGVFLMSTYEVQILDTYENRTYADGMAGALYGVKPPDKNALLPSGQWQQYDIWFRRPVFDAQGKLLTAAYVTVLVNGVLVQNNIPFDGASTYKPRLPYRAHADALPLRLQYHSQLVHFRNIWIEPLADDKVVSPAGPLGK